MTTCSGGMVTTNDSNLAEYAISLRHHGVGQKLDNMSIGSDLNHIDNLGNNWLMSEISALLGIYQLRDLETNILRRNEIAKMYVEELMNVHGIGPKRLEAIRNQVTVGR